MRWHEHRQRVVDCRASRHRDARHCKLGMLVGPSRPRLVQRPGAAGPSLDSHHVATAIDIATLDIAAVATAQPMRHVRSLWTPSPAQPRSNTASSKHSHILSGPIASYSASAPVAKELPKKYGDVPRTHARFTNGGLTTAVQSPHPARRHCYTSNLTVPSSLICIAVLVQPAFATSSMCSLQNIIVIFFFLDSVQRSANGSSSMCKRRRDARRTYTGSMNP
ncbi:hypothetical protein EXIGLDRAFT_238682 [Exidia glandulosa HHB12029]|uniref:Uncharacterized protein n=1 Tax=Exidia glandulosa HHB12029 TaxID=1314781 RepID=A0A165DYV8_EXIGL|nr:hypothetical protein EXIGLDRAFT_238682 [Exidia glandulosa HHB12029]